MKVDILVYNLFINIICLVIVIFILIFLYFNDNVKIN